MLNFAKNICGIGIFFLAISEFIFFICIFSVPLLWYVFLISFLINIPIMFLLGTQIIIIDNTIWLDANKKKIEILFKENPKTSEPHENKELKIQKVGDVSSSVSPEIKNDESFDCKCPNCMFFSNEERSLCLIFKDGRSEEIRQGKNSCEHYKSDVGSVSNA